MKTIGLIGGMSWESSAAYYRLINEAVRDRLGGWHSAQMLMYSVDFAPIKEMQEEGRWEAAGAILADAARRLEAGGADFLILGTNTMHKMADRITAAVGIPLVHIADAAAEAVKRAGLSRVGLLGTRFTMEQDFYQERLRRHDLEVIVPDAPERRAVDDVIFQELCLGTIRMESRDAFKKIIDGLARRGAEGIILGCTEIGLLVGPNDAPYPLFDTTRLHAERAVELALDDVRIPS